ncbi:MAG: peptide chain release factor N(5)-glutamine methyltransferase, partial [bacterium]|nr:peptide chain release factor N(5)-glutamine methyltransferase [bacterium]
PYLTPCEADALPEEPRLALDGGDDGLDVIRRLLRDLGNASRLPRRILLEHAPGQTESIHQLAMRPATTHSDLAGRERVTEF